MTIILPINKGNTGVYNAGYEIYSLLLENETERSVKYEYRHCHFYNFSIHRSNEHFP